MNFLINLVRRLVLRRRNRRTTRMASSSNSATTTTSSNSTAASASTGSSTTSSSSQTTESNGMDRLSGMKPPIIFCPMQESVLQSRYQHAQLKGREEFQIGYAEEEDPLTEKTTGTSDAINSSYFQCPICLHIARAPVEVACCRHWYYVSCFLKLLDKTPRTTPQTNTGIGPNVLFAACVSRAMSQQ